MDLTGAVLTNKLHLLLCWHHEPNLALVDTLAAATTTAQLLDFDLTRTGSWLVAQGLATRGSFAPLRQERDSTLVHLRRVACLGAYVRIANSGAETLQLDLLGMLASSSHDCREETCAANLPQLECQVDGRVSSQVGTLGVKHKTCHIASVPLEDLPLGRGSDVIDSNWSIVGADCQSL